MKTIKGYVDGIVLVRKGKDIASINVFTHPLLPDMKPALLLISEGDTHPEMPEFTREQVRELLKEVLTYVATAGIDDGCGGSVATRIIEEDEVIEAFTNHGIHL